MKVPPKWKHTPLVHQLPTKEVQVPPWREPTMPSAQTHKLVVVPSRRSLVLSVGSFGQAKPAGLGHIDNAESDLMHHQYRLSILQRNPVPARRNPTQIIAATCGRFHAVILQEASDHVPHISDQLIAYTGNTDLAILLNKDTFELTLRSSPLMRPRPARKRGAW